METHPLTLGCAAVIALLAASPAQQIYPTTPVLNATQEGVASSLAFSFNAYHRTQTIYESQTVYRSIQQVSRLLLRPDSGPFQPDFPAMTRHLTVRMSGHGVPSPELASQRSMAANYGSDLTTVLADKPVAFPAFSQTGQRPAPFLVSIPLDTPFPLTNIVHLLVEVETRDEGSGPTAFRWYADAEKYFGQSWTVITSTFGTGCGAPPQGFGASATGTELQTVLSFPRVGATSHPAVAWVGASTSSWGPLPLPLPLSFVGAPGCFLYTEPTATFVGMTGGGSAERFYFNVPLPREYSLLGSTVHSQSAAMDPNAGNALSMRFSPGASFYFSSPPSPYRAMTLVKYRTPGDVPDLVQPDEALVLGVQ